MLGTSLMGTDFTVQTSALISKSRFFCIGKNAEASSLSMDQEDGRIGLAPLTDLDDFLAGRSLQKENKCPKVDQRDMTKEEIVQQAVGQSRVT
jgi:hypothetical protein